MSENNLRRLKKVFFLINTIKDSKKSNDKTKPQLRV